MTRPSRFTMPQRAPDKLDEWVQQGRESETAEVVSQQSPAVPAKGKQARLTIDLPQELHAQFKAACALQRTRMVDEVTRFIKDWTQRHG